MWKLFALSLVVLFANVNCDGHGGNDEEDPWVKVSAVVEVADKFNVYASVVQKFPMGENPSMGKLNLVTKKLGESKVTGLKTYHSWARVDNCTMWSPTDPDKFVQLFPNATESVGEKMEEVDINAFKLLEGQIVVIDGDKRYCSDVRVEDSRNMNKFYMVFSKEIEMNRMTLKEIISKKVDIGESYVAIGNVEKSEECSTAQVFINKELDDEDMLRKAYNAFKSNSDLGVFSPTEKCKSDLSDSIIAKNVMKMFAEGKLSKKDPRPPVTTCAGMSSRLAEEYKMRLKKYDCIVAQYGKKYGVSMEACAESSGYTDKRWNQNGGYEQMSRNGKDEIALKCNCQSTSGEDPEFEMYFVQLMQALGAPLDNPDIAKNKAELSKLVASNSPDPAKITKVSGKINEMQEALDKFYYKAGYGLCLLASYKDDMVMEKFKSIRKRVGDGDSEDDILKDMIIENMSLLFGMMKSSSPSEQSDFSDMKEAFMGKIKMILRLSSSCSKESERKRVWAMLSKMNGTLTKYMDEIAKMLGIDEVTEALNGIKMMIMEGPEKVATKIFLAAFASVEQEEDDPLAMKIKALLMAAKNNSEKIAEKVKDWMKNADIDKLMVAHILMIPDSEVGKGCNLKQLGEKVMSYTKSETSASSTTPCSKTAQGLNSGVWNYQRDPRIQYERPRYESKEWPQYDEKKYYTRSQWEGDY